MTISITSEIPDDLAAEIAGTNNFRLLEVASRKGRLLALMLRGGRKASPNVGKPLVLAKELSAWLRAIHDRWPRVQRTPTDDRGADGLPENVDLPTVLSAVGRDVRYLENLTRGGVGMSANVVMPLRVLDALIAKLEAVQARWPESQGPGATPSGLTRRPRGSRILDEMVASGEVNLHPDPIVPNPLDRIIAEDCGRDSKGPPVRPDRSTTATTT
jgi:hypothetical protein